MHAGAAADEPVYDGWNKQGHGVLADVDMASPALEFNSEGYVLGLGAKMFVIAGPVIVYGVSASVVYGIIYYIVGLFMK